MGFKGVYITRTFFRDDMKQISGERLQDHWSSGCFLVLDDKTRVKLAIKDGISGSDYINATYIDVSITLINIIVFKLK